MVLSALEIAVIGDQASERNALSRVLQAEGYKVLELSFPGEGEESLDVDVNLYILDINLPGEDGISLAKRIRLENQHCGILILSSIRTQNFMAEGYSNGADICLSKPVATCVVLAAIYAMGRRLSGVWKKHETTRWGMTLS